MDFAQNCCCLGSPDPASLPLGAPGHPLPEQAEPSALAVRCEPVPVGLGCPWGWGARGVGVPMGLGCPQPMPHERQHGVSRGGLAPCPGEGGHIPRWCWERHCTSPLKERGWLVTEKRISIAGCSFPASEELLSVGGCGVFFGFSFFFFNSIPNLFQIKNKRCCISVCQSL